MKLVNKIIGAATLAIISASAPASAACWSVNAVEAAFVQDLESTFMTATKRCRAQGIDMTADYNRFAHDKYKILSSASNELRHHFAGGRPSSDATNAYNAFASSLIANHESDGPMLDCAGVQQLIKAAVQASSERSTLVEFAIRAGSNPSLPAESCGPQFAEAN
jgi:hypothetical protein